MVYVLAETRPAQALFGAHEIPYREPSRRGRVSLDARTGDATAHAFHYSSLLPGDYK